MRIFFFFSVILGAFFLFLRQAIGKIPGLEYCSRSLPPGAVYPGSAEYEKARISWNARIDAKPAVIFFCSNGGEVKAAIEWARINNKEIRIRSNGHCYEGFSTADNAAVIDVSRMLSIELSPDKKTVKVGAGNNLYRVYQELWKDRLTVPMGSYPTVGIAGLALGGGIGFSSRKMGLSCDSITEIELIDAQGNLIKANKDNCPDLFWACCGAGNGSFGVVISITFKTHSASNVIIYKINWKWEDLYKVSRAWFSVLKSSPPELMTFLRFTSKQSEKEVTSFGQFFGEKEVLKAIIKPLLDIPFLSVTIEEVSYMQAVNKWAGIDKDSNVIPVFPPTSFKATSLYLETPFTEEAVKVIDRFYSDPSARDNFTVLDSYGGAINESPRDLNAFFHRNCIASVQTLAYWENEEDKEKQLDWSRNFYKALAPYGKGAYANYSDLDLKEWGHAYYGDHWEKLISIKQKYDPKNIFHHPQSIPLHP